MRSPESPQNQELSCVVAWKNKSVLILFYAILFNKAAVRTGHMTYSLITDNMTRNQV